jgi:general secretion pathway protein G
LPADLNDLVQSDASGWLGPYAKEGELKDPWNHPYAYKSPGENKPFDLISYGKDGKPGGSSVDADIVFE